jgi:hypothetical protein
VEVGGVRRIAIVGAGFAGVAVAWHIMNQLNDDGPVVLHLYDEKGIAGGASGVAAGLLHPYTPRGKIIWRGVEGVAATLRLVEAAEAAEAMLDERNNSGSDIGRGESTVHRRGAAIAWRKGTVRPTRSLKQGYDQARFAPGAAAAGGGGVCLTPEELRRLLPGIEVPGDILEELERRRSEADAAASNSGSGSSGGDDARAAGDDEDDGGGGGGGDGGRDDEAAADDDPAPTAAMHIPEVGLYKLKSVDHP